MGPTLAEISRLLIKDNPYLSITDSVPSFVKMEWILKIKSVT